MKVPYIRPVKNEWKCQCCGSEEYAIVKFEPLIVICDRCGEMQNEDDFIYEEVEDKEIKSKLNII